MIKPIVETMCYNSDATHRYTCAQRYTYTKDTVQCCVQDKSTHQVETQVNT